MFKISVNMNTYGRKNTLTAEDREYNKRARKEGKPVIYSNLGYAEREVNLTSLKSMRDWLCSVNYALTPDKNYSPWLMGVSIPDKHRVKKDAETGEPNLIIPSPLILLDIDHGMTMRELRNKLKGIAYLSWHTHSSKPNNERMRLILRGDRVLPLRIECDYNKWLYEGVISWIKKRTGLEIEYDEACKDITRLMYMPPKGGKLYYGAGKRIPLSGIIKRADKEKERIDKLNAEKEAKLSSYAMRQACRKTGEGIDWNEWYAELFGKLRLTQDYNEWLRIRGAAVQLLSRAEYESLSRRLSRDYVSDYDLAVRSPVPLGIVAKMYKERNGEKAYLSLRKEWVKEKGRKLGGRKVLKQVSAKRWIEVWE